MTLKDLDAFGRSEEVKDFASGFFHAVWHGTVYKDGYALTSKQRPGHHIPTGTAPITLAGAMDIIQHRLKQEVDAPTQGIIRNLEAAVQSITLAEHFLNNGQNCMPVGDMHHVGDNIRVALPSMKKIVETLRQGTP